jgi:hypothetical protein
MATLLHYNGHTHPKIQVARLPEGSKFGSCALLSLGSPYPSKSKSMQDPEAKDVIHKEQLAESWSIIENNCEPGVTVPNNWINPQFAPDDWFQELPVSEISMIYGGLELLRDDIESILAKLKVALYFPIQFNPNNVCNLGNVPWTADCGKRPQSSARPVYLGADIWSSCNSGIYPRYICMV